MDFVALIKFALALSVALFSSYCLLRIVRPATLVSTLLLVILPVIAVLLISPYQRVYASHGLMHLSFVYQFMFGADPTENPLFAGGDLLYAWAHHWVVAKASLFSNIAPSWWFAILNIVTLGGTVCAIYHAHKQISQCVLAAGFAAILGLVGFSIIDIEPRAIPPIAKYFNINSTPFGIMAYAMFVLTAVRMTKVEELSILNWLLLALAVISVGFFYPILAVPLLISAACCGLIIWIYKPAFRIRVIKYFSVLFFSGLTCIPYLLSISLGKHGPGVLQIEQGSEMLLKLINTVTIFAPSVALIYWKRLDEQWDRVVLAVLGATVFIPTALYVLVHIPTNSEYKFLLVAVLAAGLLVAVPFVRLLRAHNIAALFLLALCITPFASDLLHKGYINFHRGVANDFEESGTRLFHADSTQNALYQWIEKQTPLNALIIDNSFTVPVFARRVMYIAINRRDRADRLPDGFQITHSMLVSVLGYDSAQVNQRQNVIQDIYSDTGHRFQAVTISELQRLAQERPVFLVSRGAGSAARFARQSELKSVFQYADIEVFSVIEK